MPTKKKRVNIIPDNLPAITKPADHCPSVYTGSKLAREDPERYSRIVQSLGEAMPVTRIAKSCRVAPETVMAICQREKETVEAVQSMTAGLVNYAAQSCVMKLIQKLEDDEVPPGVLPIALGILVDKARAYAGEASAIVEHRKIVTVQDAAKELEALKAEAIKVESVEGGGAGPLD